MTYTCTQFHERQLRNRIVHDRYGLVEKAQFVTGGQSFRQIVQRVFGDARPCNPTVVQLLRKRARSTRTFVRYVYLPFRLSQISNFMFHLYYQPPYTGLDLLSVDIARGRDVGLQPYNQVRNFCGLPLANDFEHLADLIHVKVRTYDPAFSRKMPNKFHDGSDHFQNRSSSE